MSLRADEYRQRAASAGRRAAQLRDLGLKKAYEQMARDWLTLAEQVEWIDSIKRPTRRETILKIEGEWAASLASSGPGYAEERRTGEFSSASIFLRSRRSGRQLCVGVTSSTSRLEFTRPARPVTRSWEGRAGSTRHASRLRASHALPNCRNEASIPGASVIPDGCSVGCVVAHRRGLDRQGG
jgi:hypothetical protein